jgi:branched-chain amino acid transport system ATP-binding protein
MEALRVEGLAKAFGGLQVLTGVSFALEVGEKLAIIGPNGAGKTTLLNVLNGQLSSLSGRIYLFGTDITGLPTQRRARLGMGRSFQITSLFPGLTVLDNVLLGLGSATSSRPRMYRPLAADGPLFAKAEEYLKVFELWEKKGDLTKNISYGEQRRLEILLCMLADPKLLMLDEPTNGLTTSESADLIKKIDRLGRDIPVIIVSHDMDLVFGIATRIIVLHQGRIVADGSPREIRADARVRNIYMGIEEEKGVA